MSLWRPLTHLAILSHNLGLSSCSSLRNTSWKKLAAIETGTLRSHVQEDRAVLKAEFQSKLKNLLKQNERGELAPPKCNEPRGTGHSKSPLVKLLLEGSDNLPYEPLDPNSKDILSDESILREFIKQHALGYESKNRFEVPECEFESYSVEDIKELLRSHTNFLLCLRRNAKRELRKAKTKSKDSKGSDKTGPRDPRRDMIPFYLLGNKYRSLVRWRLELPPRSENPLIIDMNFDHLMNARCTKDLLNQIKTMCSKNVVCVDPMHFLLTNMSEDSYAYQHLAGKSPSKSNEDAVHGFPNSFITATNKNLLELDIERENLVYLTPDAKSEMETFDESKAYIIGGLVDMGVLGGQKTTYSIARRIGIERMKFPLKKYLVWGNRSGRQELSLDVVFQVLCELRASGCWVKAFQHIPRRFYKGLTKEGLEKAHGDDELLAWYEGIVPYRIEEQSIDGQKPVDYFGWTRSRR